MKEYFIGSLPVCSGSPAVASAAAPVEQDIKLIQNKMDEQYLLARRNHAVSTVRPCAPPGSEG